MKHIRVVYITIFLFLFSFSVVNASSEFNITANINNFSVDTDIVMSILYNTSEQYTFFNAVTTNGSRYVAVGQNGMVRYSDDGVSWSGVSAGDSTLYGVTYGGGLYVAVGFSVIQHSTNGVTWTEIDIGSDNLNSIVYGDDKFVAVGSSGLIMYSADGTTWNNATSYTTNALNSITRSGSKFVAVGQGGIVMISLDGEDWSNVFAGSNNLHGVVFGNNEYVAVGDFGVYRYSSDGFSWSSSGSVTTTTSLTDVTYGQGKYVAVGSFNGVGVLVSSYDGTTWYHRNMGTPYYLSSVIPSSTSFLGVGNYETIAFINPFFSYSTTSGLIETNILKSLNRQYNITAQATGYDTQSFSNYNTATDLSVVFVLSDDVPPNTTATYKTDANVDYTLNTWSVSTYINVSLSCSDDESGCMTTYYCVDTTNSCTPNSVYSTTVSVSQQGNSYFRFYSVDNQNNIETTHSAQIKLDYTAPTTSVSAVTNTSSSYTFNTFLTTSDYINVTLTCNDGVGIGCDTITYCLDTVNSCTPGVTYSTPVTIDTQATSYIRFRSNDSLNNQESTQSRTIIIDTNKPNTNITAITDNGNTYTGNIIANSTYLNITLSCTDGDGLGCDTTYYCVDSANTCTPTTEYSSLFQITNKGTNYVRYYSTDNAGNSETVQSFTARLRQEPLFSVALVNQSVLHNNTLSYQAQCTDPDGFGIVYSVNNSILSINSSTGLMTDEPDINDTGVYTIAVTCDNGYESVSDTFVYTIINTVPYIVSNVFSPLPNDGTQDLTFSITTADDESDLVIVYSKWFINTVLQPNYTGLFTLNATDFSGDDMATIEIVLSDGILNSTPQNFSLAFNDETPPVISNITISSTEVVQSNIGYFFATCIDSASSISSVVMNISNPIDEVTSYTLFTPFENDTYRKGFIFNTLGDYTLLSVECTDSSGNIAINTTPDTKITVIEPVVPPTPPPTGGGGGVTIVTTNNIGTSSNTTNVLFNRDYRIISQPQTTQRTYELAITNRGIEDVTVSLEIVVFSSSNDITSWVNFGNDQKTLQVTIPSSSNPLDNPTRFVSYTINIPENLSNTADMYSFVIRATYDTHVVDKVIEIVVLDGFIDTLTNFLLHPIYTIYSEPVCIDDDGETVCDTPISFSFNVLGILLFFMIVVSIIVSYTFMKKRKVYKHGKR